MENVMSIYKDMKEEFEVIKARDPAIKTIWEVLLYPYFHAKRKYKKAHKLYLKGHFFRARVISQRATRKTGIEIHPGATIGKGLFIDHGAGVVIGETAVIGDNCTLYQGVTLGGTGKESGKRHPTLGNNVMISAGAKIIGSFTIGDNSKVGAGSVVIEEVPPDCTVVGVPGRIVRRHDGKTPTDTMDQCNLPDPVLADICMLRKKNKALQKRLKQLERSLDEKEKLYEKILTQKEDVPGAESIDLNQLRYHFSKDEELTDDALVQLSEEEILKAEEELRIDPDEDCGCGSK